VFLQAAMEMTMACGSPRALARNVLLAPFSSVAIGVTADDGIKIDLLVKDERSGMDGWPHPQPPLHSDGEGELIVVFPSPSADGEG